MRRGVMSYHVSYESGDLERYLIFGKRWLGAGGVGVGGVGLVAIRPIYTGGDMPVFYLPPHPQPTCPKGTHNKR